MCSDFWHFLIFQILRSANQRKYWAYLILTKSPNMAPMAVPTSDNSNGYNGEYKLKLTKVTSILHYQDTQDPSEEFLWEFQCLTTSMTWQMQTLSTARDSTLWGPTLLQPGVNVSVITKLLPMQTLTFQMLGPCTKLPRQLQPNLSFPPSSVMDQ